MPAKSEAGGLHNGFTEMQVPARYARWGSAVEPQSFGTLRIIFG